MYVFTPKCGSPSCHVFSTDCTKHASARAGSLIHQQQTIYWIFTQTTLNNIYRHKSIVSYWALTKGHAFLMILLIGETRTCNYFFDFSVAKTRKRVARGGKL